MSPMAAWIAKSVHFFFLALSVNYSAMSLVHLDLILTNVSCNVQCK